MIVPTQRSSVSSSEVYMKSSIAGDNHMRNPCDGPTWHKFIQPGLDTKAGFDTTGLLCNKHAANQCKIIEYHHQLKCCIGACHETIQPFSHIQLLIRFITPPLLVNSKLPLLRVSYTLGRYSISST